MTLEQCVDLLRAENKLWMYETLLKDGMSEDQKLAIANKVIASPKQWAQRLYEERRDAQS